RFHERGRTTRLHREVHLLRERNEIARLEPRGRRFVDDRDQQQGSESQADSNPLLPARAAGPDPWHRRPPRSGGHSPRYYRKRERNGGSVGALLALRVGTRNKRGRLRRPITRPRPGIEPTPDGEVS